MEKEVKCGETEFSCKKKCEKELDCENHQCQDICHPGDCMPCELKPEKVNKCPCGKFDLTMLVGENSRKSCEDPIPVCGLPCKKLLPCGEHYCTKTCHNGECMPC